MIKTEALLKNLTSTIRGKDDRLRLVLAAMLAGGHILLEDVPGTGKTLLAKALASSIDGVFQRVQFTPDLLPTDLTGTSIYLEHEKRFEFRNGPLFCDVLLADELNRATPRTQSALLEAMEERQVTADGTTYKLSPNFFVIATQNPIEQQGVYDLPEAQLDRFMMRLSLGYPDRDTEVEIVASQLTRSPLDSLERVISTADITGIQDQIRNLHVDESIIQYAISLATSTRGHESLVLGASTRAVQALVRGSQALAYLDQREFVTPDHIKQLAVPVLSHRLVLHHRAALTGRRTEDIVSEIVEMTEVPLLA